MGEVRIGIVTVSDRASAGIYEDKSGPEIHRVLEKITIASTDGSNLFPLILEAVRMNATLGEIMASMKQVFGTYSAPSGF